MATELQEFTQEEALKKKIRQKKRIRGCLIVLNALLLCYFSYLMVDTIVERVVEKKQEIKVRIELLNILLKKGMKFYSEITGQKLVKLI